MDSRIAYDVSVSSALSTDSYSSDSNTNSSQNNTNYSDGSSSHSYHSDEEKWWATSNSSESSTSSSESSTSSTSDEYERTYAMRDDVKVETTFIQNRFKDRKHPGIYVKPKFPKTCIRNTPSKLLKWRLIKLKNKYYHEAIRAGIKPTVRKFMEQYQEQRSGYKTFINKLSYRTWQDYHTHFKVNSDKFKKLEKYIDKYPEKKTNKLKRFYRDQFAAKYGICPIFEQWLVTFRAITSKEYEWRSVTWFLTETKRFIKNKKILNLLKPFMTRREWKLLKLVKVSRFYIYHILVLIIKVPI